MAKIKRSLIALVDNGQVKPLVIDLDPQVHTNGQKCGDSTCPCFEDDSFSPLVVSPAFQARMDNLLIEDSHDRALRAPLNGNREFNLMR